MRLVALATTAALMLGCATPAVGTWRADGAAAVEAPAASPMPEPQAWHKYEDHWDRTDALVGCLGASVIVGGAAAIIYLTRFRGGRGSGGDVGEPGLEKPLLLPQETASANEPIEPSVCGAICGEKDAR